MALEEPLGTLDTDSIEALIRQEYDGSITLCIYKNERVVPSVKELFDDLLKAVEAEAKPCSLKIKTPSVDSKHGHSSLCLVPLLDIDIISNAVSLDYLVKLDLSDIDLKSIELESNLEFGHLTNLEHLVLNNTNTRHLHPSVGRLENLSSLSLRHNRLYDLPVTVRLLRNLTYLDITGNFYRTLPGALFHMLNLKTIDGLNDNLLECNPHWNKDNSSIAFFPPLLGSKAVRENVDSLQSLCMHYAIGMNVWKIPLPLKHVAEITERTVLYDLCEVCRVPVKRITAYHESDGFMIKVCLVHFQGIKNVPLKFYTCSSNCCNKLVENLESLQKLYAIQLSKMCNQGQIPEVVLKDPRCKSNRFSTYLTKKEPSTSQETTKGTKCIIS